MSAFLLHTSHCTRKPTNQCSHHQFLVKNRDPASKFSVQMNASAFLKIRSFSLFVPGVIVEFIDRKGI